MATDIEFNNENLDDVLNLICECGHKLSYHGFVDGTYDANDKFLRVSQCVFCEYGVCKEFKQASSREE